MRRFSSILSINKPEYVALHENIINYVKFLRDRAVAGTVNDGLLFALYTFKEVRQNGLGFSKRGNGGSGLGKDFARSLCANLRDVFPAFGNEKITESSHLEKLCLIEGGVGRDNISDFSTNLIKGFLLEYTQTFAKQFLSPDRCGMFTANRVSFNYRTGTWNRGRYFLPEFNGDYVLLTPKDILTKDDTWISRADMLDRIQEVADALPDDALRTQFNDYIASRLKGEETAKERHEVLEQAVSRFPDILDYYIREQEEHGEKAVVRSSDLVRQTQDVFVENVQHFVDRHLVGSPFYSVAGNTLEEARERVLYLKHVIENSDGYRLFYNGSQPIRREDDVQLLYLLTWYATPSDVNREANNGRGPVDFKISRGSRDKSLVEFKLAANAKLKRNLENQVRVYETANRTNKSLKVIVYFTATEEEKVVGILKDLGLESVCRKPACPLE